MQNSLSHTKHLIEAQKCPAAHRLRTTGVDCRASWTGNPSLEDDNIDHGYMSFRIVNELSFIF